MGKFKFIFILIVALVFICGIVMVVEAPTSFDDSLSLIPVSDSNSAINVSDCANGSCLVDSNGRYAVSNSSNSSNFNANANKENHDDQMDYDSKYYDDSFIEGLYFCNNLEQAFKDAQAHNKNVMIIFDGAACIYCEYLKDEGLTDSDVQKEINENDILLITQTSESPELASQLNIHGTPTTVIFDKDGNELGRIVGYDNPQQYLSELKEYNG